MILFLVVLPVTELQKGFGSLVTAIPSVTRPSTKSCTVSLAKDEPFSKGESPYLASYSSPSECSTPWSKVVLDWWGRVDGKQTDRVAGLWIGSVELLRTTTPLTDPSGLSWHVDKDVTEYAALLSTNQTVTIVLPNYVGQGATGVIHITATLTFFITSLSYPEPRVADEIAPLFHSQQSPWFVTQNGTVNLGTNLALPARIVEAHLDIYATPHSPCDEFWYAVDLTGCSSNSPFRELDVFIDGIPAGLAIPLPIMYSGAINSALWKPVPSIDALNVPPYSINLTPFVGTLTNGKPHSISFEILNYRDRWRVDGDLFLFLDQRSVSTSGPPTLYQVSEGPISNTTQVISGTKVMSSTFANRSIVLSGVVFSSLGQTKTTVKANMLFNNTKIVDLISLEETVRQSEVTTTVMAVVGAGGNITDTLRTSYDSNMTFSDTILTFVLAASVDSLLAQAHQTVVNGTMTGDYQFLDEVRASTLGPYPLIGSERTIETFGQGTTNVECPKVTPQTTLCLQVSGDRINVGLTGLELIVGLWIVFDIALSPERKRVIGNYLYAGGFAMIMAGVTFGVLKFNQIGAYDLQMFWFLVDMSPEIAVAVVGCTIAFSVRSRLRKTLSA